MRVSTIQLRALIEAFETHGGRGAELIAASGIAPELLSAGYAWIDIAAFDRATRVALELSRDAAFGLHWGERSAMQQFDLLPALVASASNLRSGIQCLLRFQEILSDHVEFRFEELAGRARFRFEPCAISGDAARVRADFALSAFGRLLKYVAGDMERIECVAVAHERPAYGSEYDRIFAGTRLRFGAPECAISFDRRLLDEPLLLQNPMLHRTLDQHAENVRSLVLDPKSLHERVQRQLSQTMPEGLDMPRIARALGLSERSLRRRLESEGYSFKALVESTKQSFSRQLLSDASRPIKEVARRVGFADVRAFHRAFRRWTGTTPSAFRRDISRSN